LFLKKALHLTALLFGLGWIAPAQTIPKSLWGKWIVQRELPTTTISCWGDKEAKALLGTELEYSPEFFRWNKIITENPTAEVETITAAQFHDENSGRGANSSQITLQQLGITKDSVVQIVIRHPAASITGGTVEIPGDGVLVKDENTLVFSVCNVYFEAKRRTARRHK
jgi:hypothetical protein